MVLSRVVSEIFNVKIYRNLEILEILVKASQGHWKWYHSIDWVRFLISVL